MKNDPVKIKNIAELRKFRRMVRKNHLYGQIQQKDFTADVRSVFTILMALPLDNASISLTNCPEHKAVEIENQFRAFA